METLYQSESPPLEVLRFIGRHRGKVLLTFSAVIAATLAFLSLATREFQSEAKIFVRLGRESMSLDPTATTGQYVAVADSRESEIQAVEELLVSRSTAEKIVDQFGPAAILEKDPEKPGLGQRLAWLDGYNLNPLRVYSLRDKALLAFRKNLGVIASKKSNVVTVSYQAENPQFAHDVLVALIRATGDEHLRVHQSSGTQAFFEKQCELLRANLAHLEEQLRDVKNETGFAALATQRDIQLQLIGSLEADLLRAKAERDAAQAEVEQRRRQLRELEPLIVTEQTTGLPQTARQTLREKLYELEVQEQHLASYLKEEAPRLAQVRSAIAEARKIMQDEQISTQTTKGINLGHQAAESALRDREAQLAALTARTQSLDAKITSEGDKLKKLNSSEVEIARLERDIDLARTNFRSYSENLEQARIDRELDAAKISSLNLLQPPSLSETPVSPAPIPTLALGFAVAVLSSLGLALVADRRGASRAATAAISTPVVRESAPAPLSTRSRRNEMAPANPR